MIDFIATGIVTLAAIAFVSMIVFVCCYEAYNKKWGSLASSLFMFFVLPWAFWTVLDNTVDDHKTSECMFIGTGEHKQAILLPSGADYCDYAWDDYIHYEDLSNEPPLSPLVAEDAKAEWESRFPVEHIKAHCDLYGNYKGCAQISRVKKYYDRDLGAYTLENPNDKN